jgi:hypothetical protein
MCGGIKTDFDRASSLDVAVSEGISQLRGHLPERLRLATHESDTADIGGKAKPCVVRLEFG